MRKIQFIGILLLGLVFILGACAPKAAPAPAKAPSPAPAPTPAPAPALSEWDKVLAAGKKEGTITLYNVLGVGLGDAIKAGMKQYGINVETVAGNGGEMQVRVEVEQRAKAYVADALISGWTNVNNLLAQGYLQPVKATLPSLQEKDVWKMRPDQHEPTKSGFIYATAITPSVLANTDLVRKGEIQSWSDLLDPRWAGKIVMSDPRPGQGPGSAGISAWSTVLGEEFWKKLAAQRVTLHIRYEIPVNQVTFGEKAIAIFPAYSQSVAAIKAGAPMQIMHLKEGTSYYVNGVGFIANAPHPNAVLVLLNWMFSKEGQAAMGRAMETYTVRKDVSEDWFKIAELRPGTFTFLEPPNNLDPESSKRGGVFGKTIFGAQ
ncbi:MAG: extracellular solute-binding protein family 1 [Dehalococcoidia bacterium]|nr:extracellular solute-binding protein family 1 [Dehalococcoidia bacterium]